MSGPGMQKLRRRGAGVAFLLVIAALITLSVQVYQQTFVPTVMVTLQTDRIGNQLNRNSEVKARGVVVGHVRDVRSVPGGAEIDLALEPATVGKISRDATALLIPKTLFGARYVQLSIPDGPVARPIAAGDTIAQDRSANAIELERVFDDLLPVLKAVQPQKLSATLTAIAAALQGRGEQLGATLASTGDYLGDLNPNLPTLTDDLRDLAEVSQLYGDIAPDLLDSLTNSTVTLNTIADQRGELGTLYAEVTSAAQDITVFLRNNKANLIGLTASSVAPLELTARYSPSFPCTFKALTDLKPAMDKVLGVGTNQPGLHVLATATQSRGKYEPGKDEPVYQATGGPRCYPSGVAPTAGVVSAPTGSTAHPLSAGAGGALGLPNSPQERELIATLLAPSLGVAPAQVAPWSSVLVGPLYRGTEVTLR